MVHGIIRDNAIAHGLIGDKSVVILKEDSIIWLSKLKYVFLCLHKL